jgi:hypothetical protein
LVNGGRRLLEDKHAAEVTIDDLAKSARDREASHIEQERLTAPRGQGWDITEEMPQKARERRDKELAEERTLLEQETAREGGHVSGSRIYHMCYTLWPIREFSEVWLAHSPGFIADSSLGVSFHTRGTRRVDKRGVGSLATGHLAESHLCNVAVRPWGAHPSSGPFSCSLWKFALGICRR